MWSIFKFIWNGRAMKLELCVYTFGKCIQKNDRLRKCTFFMRARFYVVVDLGRTSSYTFYKFLNSYAHLIFCISTRKTDKFVQVLLLQYCARSYKFRKFLVGVHHIRKYIKKPNYRCHLTIHAIHMFFMIVISYKALIFFKMHIWYKKRKIYIRCVAVHTLDIL